MGEASSHVADGRFLAESAGVDPAAEEPLGLRDFTTSQHLWCLPVCHLEVERDALEAGIVALAVEVALLHGADQSVTDLIERLQGDLLVEVVAGELRQAIQVGAEQLEPTVFAQIRVHAKGVQNFGHSTIPLLRRVEQTILYYKNNKIAMSNTKTYPLEIDAVHRVRNAQLRIAA